MATATYYFNAHSSSTWINPDNMDDDDTGNYGYVSTAGSIHTYSSNTYTSGNSSAITKVEVRFYASLNTAMSVSFTPTFSGGNGNQHNMSLNPTPQWRGWIDITTDPHAPSVWGWSDVASFKGFLKTYNSPGTVNVYANEIRVTYVTTVFKAMFIK